MSNRILLLVNHDIVIYNFRRELVERFISEGFEVIISCPNGPNIDKLVQIGAKHLDLKINRRGINPISDIKLLFHYRYLIKTYTPSIVLTYTIKPNIYGGIASRFSKTPYIANITGLGTAVENKGLLQLITTKLYKFALKNANTIFFQNKENMEFMLDRHITGKSHILIPGSGVNTKFFSYINYPISDTINFLFIGRIMKAKGIDYYLEAAKKVKEKYPNTIFHIIGDYEENYEDIISEYQNKGYIQYHGKINDVREFHKIAHCTINPTYYPEGISNVLLESAASGRPIIASNRSGCKEVIVDNFNGYLFSQRDVEDLIKKIEMFINLSYEQKKQMGLCGREKVDTEFNRDIVVNEYITAVRRIINN